MIEISTLVFMIIIFGITWGILGLLVKRAYSKEKRKIDKD